MKPGDQFNPFRIFIGLFIPNCLARHPGLAPAAKILYGRLAQYSGRDGKCIPGTEALAIEIGVSERRIRQLIKELEVAGFIKIDRSSGGNNSGYKGVRYLFVWHPIFDDAEKFSEINFRSPERNFRGSEKSFRVYKVKETQQENQEEKGSKFSSAEDPYKYSSLPEEVLQ